MARVSSGSCEVSATGPCRSGPLGPIMLYMTPASPITRRLILVPAAAAGTRPVDPRLRRYRLARLRLEDRDVTRSQRFSHLKASHD